jgi:hypothetical protein
MTFGWVVGVFAPPAMFTVVGLTVAFEESALLRVTVTPPGGALTGNVTANAVAPPSGAVTPDASPMGPAVTTVTLAVASGINVVALAWITAEPKPLPVTGTLAVVAPLANVTVAGTVATDVLLELRFTVVPAAGAAAESVSVRFCVFKPVIVADVGLKVTVAVTAAAVTAAV